MLLCSVPGYDTSGRVDNLSASQNKQCTCTCVPLLLLALLKDLILQRKRFHQLQKQEGREFSNNNVCCYKLLCLLMYCYYLFIFLKVGLTKECSFGFLVVSLTREETSFTLASRQLASLNGDQS